MVVLTRNLFIISVEDFPNEQNKGEGIQEEFLDMIHDSTVKASFEDESLEKFRGMMEKAYPKVAENPLTWLIVITSTYLCELAFSSVVSVKTKNKSSKQIFKSGLRFALRYLQNRTPYFIDCRQKNKSKHLTNCVI